MGKYNKLRKYFKVLSEQIIIQNFVYIMQNYKVFKSFFYSTRNLATKSPLQACNMIFAKNHSV